MKALAIALTCTCLASGCGEPQRSEGWAGSIDTLPGGALHVTSLRPKWSGGETWTLDAVHQLGGGSPAGPFEFGSIQDIDVDREGNVYVLDGMNTSVVVFDRDGRLRGTFGRSGDGPGELRQPMGIAVTDDGEIVVAEPFRVRYTVFTADGQVRQTLTPEIHISDWRLINPWQGVVTRDGTIIEYTSTQSGLRIAQFPTTGSGQVTGTYAVPDHVAEEMLLVDADGVLRASMPVPFASRLQRFLDRDGNLWTGDDATYRVTRSTLGGDSILIVERPMQPLPVLPFEVDSALAPAAGLLRSGGHLEGPAVPELKPAFRWFTVDDHLQLWVLPYRESAESVGALDVFGTGGEYLGVAQPTFTYDVSRPPVVRGGRFYAVARDSFDVESVVVAEIMAGAPARETR